MEGWKEMLLKDDPRFDKESSDGVDLQKNQSCMDEVE